MSDYSNKTPSTVWSLFIQQSPRYIYNNINALLYLLLIFIAIKINTQFHSPFRIILFELHFCYCLVLLVLKQCITDNRPIKSEKINLINAKQNQKYLYAHSVYRIKCNCQLPIARDVNYLHELLVC